MQGIMGTVGAGRHSAQPAGWWASQAGLEMPVALALLKVLVQEGILDVEGGSRYHFTLDGNEWARELLADSSATDNPFGEPELEMIGRSAKSAHEVVAAAQRLCQNLVFLPVCLWYSKACRAPAPYAELARTLLVLDAMATAADSQGGLGMRIEKWVHKYCVEHGYGSLPFKQADKSTEKNSARKVVVGGQPIRMDFHFTLGSGAREECVSVYFVRHPRNSRKITIGYCGPHLEKS